MKLHINILMSIFILLFLFNLSTPFFTANANLLNNSQISDKINISLNITNKINSKTLLSDDKIIIDKNSNIIALLENIKKLNLINDFYIINNEIFSISFIDGSTIENTVDSKWGFSINEISYNESIDKINISDSSFIEIYYNKIQNVQSSSSSKISNQNDLSSKYSSNLINSGKYSSNEYSNKSSQESQYDYNEKEIYDPKNNIYWDNTMYNILNNSIDYISKADISYFSIISLGISGHTLQHKDISKLINNITSYNGNYSNVIDLVNGIIAATFSGLDVMNINNINLIDILYNYENINNIKEFISALIAYDSNNYFIPNNVKNTRKYLIENILKFQTEDGGFYDSVENQSDPNITMISIISLSKYRTNEIVKNSLYKALDYVSKFIKNELYGYIYSNKVDSVLISNIITCINSMGLNLKDKKFLMYNNQNLLDVLLLFYKDNKGFSKLYIDDIDINSTSYAIIAISSLKYNSNPYMVRSNISSDKLDIDKGTNLNSNYINIFFCLGLIIIYISIFFCRYLLLKNKK